MRVKKVYTKTSPAPLPWRQVTIMAAMLGISNLGMGLPKKEEVARAKEAERQPTLASAVLDFGRRYMENDEQYAMFVEEAKVFEKDLRARPAECRKWWPDAFALYEGA